MYCAEVQEVSVFIYTVTKKQVSSLGSKQREQSIPYTQIARVSYSLNCEEQCNSPPSELSAWIHHLGGQQSYKPCPVCTNAKYEA